MIGFVILRYDDILLKVELNILTVVDVTADIQ